MQVWPENWQAFEIFADLRTQWWTGAGGPTGLNYLVLYAKLDRLGLTTDDRDALEDDIRAMEYAALDAIYEAD